jgi:hypothetical protein
MTADASTGSASPAAADAPAAPRTAASGPGRAPSRWLVPVLFAAFCALTLWCALALLADRQGTRPSPAPPLASVGALHLG